MVNDWFFYEKRLKKLLLYVTYIFTWIKNIWLIFIRIEILEVLGKMIKKWKSKREKWTDFSFRRIVFSHYQSDMQKKYDHHLLFASFLTVAKERKEKILNIIDGRRKCLEYIRLFFFPSTTLVIKKRREVYRLYLTEVELFPLFSSINLINVVDKCNIGISVCSILFNCEQTNPMSCQHSIIVTNSYSRYNTTSHVFCLHPYGLASWCFFFIHCLSFFS
jgi:hypothetical protein